MVRLILIAGGAAAGGFFIAQQADKFMAKETVKFDDKLSAPNRELLRNGIAAAGGVASFMVLSKVL